VADADRAERAERLADDIGWLKSMSEEFDGAATRVRDRVNTDAESLAEARRRGDHGRDWQLLQQWIDQGKTTEVEILCGIEKSPPARRIRKQIAMSIAARRGDLADYVATDPRGAYRALKGASASLSDSLRQALKA
jgi:hypothetical protein